MGFAGRTRVAVLHDDDLPKAQGILRRLQPPKTPTPQSWRWQKRGLICWGLSFLALVLTGATVDADGKTLLTWILLAACGLFFVAGMILIVLGPRADRQGKQEEPRVL